MEQQYQYLYGHIPEEEKIRFSQMSRGELNNEVAQLDNAWTQNHQPNLSRTKETGKKTAEKKKAGAYCSFLQAVSQALQTFQTKNYIQEACLREKPNLNSYLNGLAWLSDVTKNLKDEKREAFSSDGYRDILKNYEEYSKLEKCSLKSLFIIPVIFALIWFGLYKLFTADFMPEFLAKPIWENISYVVLLIIAIGLIILFVSVGTGFIASVIIGIVIASLLAVISVYGFALVLKLFPAIAPAFEQADEYIAVLCFPLFLILLITTIANIPSVFRNLKAIGKKSKMRTKVENIRKNLLNKAWERTIYGMILETADVCEANSAWTDGGNGLTRYSAEEAAEIIGQVREYFVRLCEGYDNAQNIVKAAR